MTSDEIRDLMTKCSFEITAKRLSLISEAHDARWPSDGNKLVELAEELNELLLDEFQLGLAEDVAEHVDGKHPDPCEHPACDIPLSELKEMAKRLYDRWAVCVL